MQMPNAYSEGFPKQHLQFTTILLARTFKGRQPLNSLVEVNDAKSNPYVVVLYSIV